VQKEDGMERNAILDPSHVLVVKNVLEIDVFNNQDYVQETKNVSMDDVFLLLNANVEKSKSMENAENQSPLDAHVVKSNSMADVKLQRDARQDMLTFVVSVARLITPRDVHMVTFW